MLHHKFLIILLVITTMFGSTLQWRSQSSVKMAKKDEKEEFNIGLIAPHTNFGKREYLRAINSAIQSLQKMRGTKSGFTQSIAFSSTNVNVHFDMMSLTPSPTSKWIFVWFFFFRNCIKKV